MKFKADEIASVIQQEIEQFESRIDVREVGRVIEVGDGIARVYGLSGVMSGEMVQFPGDIFGLAFNLEENSVGVIILGDYLEIEEGDEVSSTGRLLSVPVGDAVLGRVIDPLGNPLDGGGAARHHRAAARRIDAPGVAERQPVKQPLANRHQGHRRHDAHRPRPARVDHRRPQDRQDGHLHRHDHQSEGHRREMLLRGHRAEGIERGRADRGPAPHGAMDYTTVIVAGASDPAPLQYIAPYAGCAMAEYFMYKGQDALIIYDDLSKQAQAYRQISLLMRRPPGREAYPGDIFYCPQPAAGAGRQAQR